MAVEDQHRIEFAGGAAVAAHGYLSPLMKNLMEPGTGIPNFMAEPLSDSGLAGLDVLVAAPDISPYAGLMLLRAAGLSTEF